MSASVTKSPGWTKDCKLNETNVRIKKIEKDMLKMKGVASSDLQSSLCLCPVPMGVAILNMFGRLEAAILGRVVMC